MFNVRPSACRSQKDLKTVYPDDPISAVSYGWQRGGDSIREDGYNEGWTEDRRSAMTVILSPPTPHPDPPRVSRPLVTLTSSAASRCSGQKTMP